MCVQPEAITDVRSLGKREEPRSNKDMRERKKEHGDLKRDWVL